MQFQFQQFTIRQDRCAMKVGTDGTLLGAWARGGASVLDIGTGTGLIALMLAQRYPHARVVGIDIDEASASQARENVLASPFHHVEIVHADVKDYQRQDQTFAAIVCNPPFFVRSLACPDERRNVARHATTLTYRELMAAAWQLLADDGEFSVVIPSESKALLEQEAALTVFFKSRECAVKTTPCKPPRRYLLAFRKHASELELAEGVIETAPNVRSEWYQTLTQDFYLVAPHHP